MDWTNLFRAENCVVNQGNVSTVIANIFYNEIKAFLSISDKTPAYCTATIQLEDTTGITQQKGMTVSRE